MIIVTGIVELRPDTVEKFKEISADNLVASRAEAGCHGYAYYQDIENPCIFRPYEIWEDEATLIKHFQEPHTQAFTKALREIGVVRFDVYKYERGETAPIG